MLSKWTKLTLDKKWTKMDKNEQKRTNVVKMDKMDKVDKYGQKWTKWTKSRQNVNVPSVSGHS